MIAQLDMFVAPVQASPQAYMVPPSHDVDTPMCYDCASLREGKCATLKHQVDTRGWCSSHRFRSAEAERSFKAFQKEYKEAEGE